MSGNPTNQAVGPRVVSEAALTKIDGDVFSRSGGSTYIFDNQNVITVGAVRFVSGILRKESAPMEFTRSKTRQIYASHLFAAFVSVVALAYLLLKHVPHGTLYWVQLGGIVGLMLLILSFPACWALFPRTHPVHRALAVHGDAVALASQLDAEMALGPEVQSPFYFTSSFLAYSPGYTLDVVPYDSVLSALKTISDSGEGPAIPVVVVHTKQGKTYEWHRTWMQGMFDADQVLLTIRTRANLTQKIRDVYYRTGDPDKTKSAS